MELAPIVLFVYNRPWHTEQTLNALMKNELADKSVLYIYADGQKANESKEKLIDIGKVRKLIKTKKWCKEVHIIESLENKGLANSIIDGISKIINKYGKAIILEDDIVTSHGFLEFMNKNLDYYKDEQQVFGISGYCYPNKNIKGTTYFLPIGSSWGWATWEKKWNKISFNSCDLLETIKKKRLQKIMNFGGYKYYEMLEAQVKEDIDSWAICFYASFFLKKGLFLLPNASLVQNIGFDNTGIHCNTDNHFSIVEKEEIGFFEKIPIKVNENIFKKIQLTKNPDSIIKSFVKKIYNHFK